MPEQDLSLDNIRNAWLAGRSALDLAPTTWRDAVGADELALLALTGHATDVLTRQAPAASPPLRPLLQPVATPPLADPLRSRFRRLLATPKNAPSWEKPLIYLLAARGFAAHPADWMPGAQDDWAPEFYGPWIDWVRAEASSATEDAITVENYDHLTWTERRAALWSLRASNPAAAREIIAAKGVAEPADRRLALVQLLDNGLGEEDAAYLESLSKDRSDRVRELARTFLGRLGRYEGDVQTLAAELAAMVEIEKVGLINRRTRLAIKSLKTNAQNARRRDLFRLTSLTALANALSISEADLTDAAPDGMIEGLLDFVAMVAATGSDGACRTLLESFVRDAPAALIHAAALTSRLTPKERRDILPAVLKHDSPALDTTFAVAGSLMGELPFAVFRGSSAYASLRLASENNAHTDDQTRANAAQTLNLVLSRAGLLLDAQGSRTLLTELTSWGLSPADPRLDMLHFNAALAPEKPT